MQAPDVFAPTTSPGTSATQLPTDLDTSRIKRKTEEKACEAKRHAEERAVEKETRCGEGE